jgi:hypothetical protein
MAYADLSPSDKEQVRDYVHAAHERFADLRDSKETMAFAGLAVFLGAVSTALASRDWPPEFAQHRPWLVLLAFAILWLLVAVYLRYQLRMRRWAALRVAGCDWLLAEWLPDSPQAMSKLKDRPDRPPEPSYLLLALDVVVPLRRAVVAIDPTKTVYPPEIEESWLRAAERPTKTLSLEYIIHAAGWIGFFSVCLRTLAA